MGKEKSKDKKEKKERRSDTDGVKKAKKDKKEKSVDAAVLAEAVEQVEANGVESVAVVVDAVRPAEPLPAGALVPFANPLADDKTGKKVLKGVKKAAKSKHLKRGVKEVVKALRKSSQPSPTTPADSTPSGVVVLAADISPMDVISHIPVLCEDHGIPYVYVPSRAELGAAGSTKRPTSVVLVGREGREEGWEESFGELVRVVRRAGRDVRV